MSKKLLIPLIVFIMLLAAGFGIFIASNQSAQPPSTNAAPQKAELAVNEIDRTITVPTDLGKMSYQATSPTNLLFYSEKYEKLAGCAGRPLAELRLGTTDTEGTLHVGGPYAYAIFAAQPFGICGADDGEQLAGVLQTALADAR